MPRASWRSGESPNALDSFRHDALQAECDGVSLRDWSNEMCRRLRREAQGIVETGDEIQLLTCWKAKGLEWPVVIPLGLGRKINEKSSQYPRVQHDADGVTVHLSAATLDVAFKQAVETREREELQRLFYVMFTREVVAGAARQLGDLQRIQAELSRSVQMG